MSKFFIQIVFGLLLVMLTCFQGGFTHPTKHRNHTKFTIAFEDCGSKYDVIAITITNCNYSNRPCELTPGQTVEVVTEFANEGSIPTEKLTHEAYWVLNTINTRAAITPDACEQSSCPLAADDGFLLTNQLFVNSTLPSLRGTLYWRLHDEDGELMLCYKIPITITS